MEKSNITTTFFYESSFLMPLFMKYAISKKLHVKDKFFSPDHNYVYLIKSGMLKVSVTNEDGNERLLWLLGQGCIIPTFATKMAKQIDIILDSEFLVMEQENLNKLMFTKTECFNEFMAQIYWRYEEIIQRFINSAEDSCKTRFYKLLYDLAIISANGHKTNILLKNYFSRCDMASIIGTHTTNISKYCLELEKKGIIERDGRQLVVTDLSLLAEILFNNTTNKE